MKISEEILPYLANYNEKFQKTQFFYKNYSSFTSK